MNHNPLSRATDPVTSHRAEEVYKASGAQERQAETILRRLRAGPARAIDLAAVSLKYTGRISDLRKEGHRIDYDTKTKLYTLQVGDGTQMEMDL